MIFLELSSYKLGDGILNNPKWFPGHFLFIFFDPTHNLKIFSIIGVKENFLNFVKLLSMRVMKILP